MWAAAAASGSIVLVAVGEELDDAGRVGELVLARLDPERPRAAGDEVEPPVGHPLEHLGDLARAADRPQPVVGEPDDPELRLLLQAARDHRLVALLEDVQRDQLARQGDEPEREQRKVPDQLHDDPVYGASPVPAAMADRPGLVPARPARARSPAAAGGAGRVRARGPGVRARRAAARRRASGSRDAFLFACLKDLRESLQAARREPRGASRGTPEQELPKLAARARRDRRLLRLRRARRSPCSATRTSRRRSSEAGVEPRRTPGNFIADIGKLKPYAVFTPFWRAWARAPAARVHGAPRKVPVPSDLTVGRIPAARPRPWLTSRRRDRGPQAHARLRPHDLRRHPHRLDRERRCSPPYLHFGASAPASSRSAPAAPTPASSPGATSTPTSSSTTRQHQARAPAQSSTRIEWDGTDEHFDAWREGRTGFPGRRRRHAPAAQTGWMHNRARLITACFLVKDLHIDWRRGERHFMDYLLDGDVAQNNGNWQWICSVGVDPAPLHPPPLQPDPAGAAPRPRRRLRGPLGARQPRRWSRSSTTRSSASGRWRRTAARAARKLPRMTSSTFSATSPTGVPPLHLTGERTLPDVPEENYWYRRHLVVYEWIAERVHGRKVVDLACGEGYGSDVLARTAQSRDRRRRQPRGVRARARQVHARHVRAQHGRDLAGRRGLRRVPADDRAHPGPGRDARPRPRADRARRRRLRLHAERAHARAEGRRALRQPVARPRVQARASTASCASATSTTSTCSASSTRASCARTSSRSKRRAGTACTPRCTSRARSTSASPRRSPPATSRCGAAGSSARSTCSPSCGREARPAHPHALRRGLRHVAVRRGVAVGGDRDLLPAAARRARPPPRQGHAVDHAGARRPARGAGGDGALPGVPARRSAPPRTRSTPTTASTSRTRARATRTPPTRWSGAAT